MRTLLQWSAHLLRRWADPTSRNLLATALLLGGPSRRPRPIAKWPERRVLVLAPHADDEVIGCGGAVALHVAAGAEVKVVIATDGARGDARLLQPNLTDEARASIQKEVVRRRQQEALEASRVLGVAEPEFLGAPDGALRADGEFVAQLTRIVAEFRPEMVYLPFVMDQHEDHWQCNHLLAQAVARRPRGSGAMIVRGYEVWAPLVANRLADITSVAAIKQAALEAYRSQLDDRDYKAAIGGLNKYRAMHLPQSDGRQAEAFFEASLEGYLHLLQAMRRRPQRGGRPLTVS